MHPLIRRSFSSYHNEITLQIKSCIPNHSRQWRHRPNRSQLRNRAYTYFSTDDSSGARPLKSPTIQDAKELFRRMNNRPGSMISSFDMKGHPSESWNQTKDSLDRYNQDWTKHYHGNSSIVVRPNSTQEVSSIVSYCHDQHIGIVPQAGNTGLVGGSVPLQNEIILSVEQLNKIHGIDATTGILKCEAGCILQDLQDFAATAPTTTAASSLPSSSSSRASTRFLVPVDLGAKGTCRIGGNVSTNAGGSYYHRYGSLHANVIGLEVVLPNGQIMDLSYQHANLKDNTGYHMKHLFIGGEGTLGVVTQVALLCPQYSQSKCAALVACTSFDQVQQTLQIAKAKLGEILAAFEYMDEHVLKLVQNATQSLSSSQSLESIVYHHPYCILIETHGSNEEHDKEKMEHFVEQAMEEGMVVDGILAQDYTQVEAMWRIRESCNPSCAATGYVYKYDVSLPIPDFPRFIQEMQHHIKTSDMKSDSGEPLGNIVTANWGHVIDGNLHFNVVVPGIYEPNISILKLL